MTVGKDKPNYHHGNLRASLIEHAIALLEAEGLAALSLRRIAREAGVSQAAPYGHFEGKRGLLTAVAREGYSRFTRTMRDRAEAHPNYLVGLGIGYIEFALDNPALFHLMFGGDLSELIDGQEPDKAFIEGYQLLVDAVTERPLEFPGPAHVGLDTAFAWSLVHGLAHLLMAERFSGEHYGFDDRDVFIETLLKRHLLIE